MDQELLGSVRALQLGVSRVLLPIQTTRVVDEVAFAEGDDHGGGAWDQAPSDLEAAPTAGTPAAIGR